MSWDDVTPRMGVAYDLFGNGKTAVKVNIGKYMEAFTATNSDLDLNPLIRTDRSARRGRGPTRNKDFVPNCDLRNPDEERRVRRNGRQELRARKCSAARYDPGFIGGWG